MYSNGVTVLRAGRRADRRDEASSRFWQIALRETAKSHVRCYVYVTRVLRWLLAVLFLGLILAF
jgi:hypothetical protein